jgi:hypothetical protein
VAKVLKNRAVIGEFQPCVLLDGKGSKRIPEGEPIQGYYPAIVLEDLFYRVQHGKEQRRKNGAGRKGVGYTNLFTGLARCAYCKSRIVFENKGAGAHGGTYLVCDSAQRGRGCKAARWRYKDFEASFLAFVQEVDLESIVNASEDAEKRKEIADELSAIRGELASKTELMEKTYALLQSVTSTEFVAGKLDELAVQIALLNGRLAAKEAEQLQFGARDSRFYSGREEIKELVIKLQMPASDELYKLRAQIAARLKSLVETLLIAPIGNLPVMRGAIDQLQAMAAGEAEDVIAHMERVAANPEQSRRYFAVGFRDAAVRIVFPAYDDPLRFEQQIVTGQGLVEGAGPLVETIDPSGDHAAIF